MSILVLALGAISISIGLAVWIYQLTEHSRKQTEKTIALFYRDYPAEAVEFLNQIAEEETKKETHNNKHKEEYGF